MSGPRAFLSGLLIGLAEAVPGLSGASAALLLGVYDRALERAAGLLRGAGWKPAPTKSSSLDPPCASRGDARAAGRGVASSSPAGQGGSIWPALAGLALAFACWPLVLFPLQRAWPGPLRAVLLGLAGAGLVHLLRRPVSWKAHHASLILLSAALSWKVLGQPLPEDPPASGPFLVLGGVSFSAALVLPGVSGLLQLPVFGAHAALLDALGSLARGRVPEALAAAGPFLAGAAIGLAATVLCLAYLLERHRDMTSAMLLGFYAGALHRLWPFREETAAMLLGRTRFTVADTAVLPPPAAPATWAVLGLALAAFVLAILLLPPAARQGGAGR